MESNWRKNVLDRDLGWGPMQWCARVLSGPWTDYYVVKYYGLEDTGELVYFLRPEEEPDIPVFVLGPYSSPWPYGYEVEPD